MLSPPAISFSLRLRCRCWSLHLLALVAPIVVTGVIHDLRTRGATAQAMLGALALYTLLSMLFAGLYGAIADLGLDAFFTDGTAGDLQARLYFNFVTLTNFGYENFSPATPTGRTFSTWRRCSASSTARRSSLCSSGTWARSACAETPRGRAVSTAI